MQTKMRSYHFRFICFVLLLTYVMCQENSIETEETTMSDETTFFSSEGTTSTPYNTTTQDTTTTPASTTSSAFATTTEESVPLKKDSQKPNIVFIVADDLGWDDVSFHGSDQIITSNLDIIAYEGIVLQNYYTDTQGTPSRSALFTGKYPLRLGIQGPSILAVEDRGIPITERLLPDYLKELGYKTHLIGKWHVGKSREHYLPTYRGFDTFYGFLDGSVDYYTFNLVENWNQTSYFGFNLYDNLKPAEEAKGYLTDIFTNRAVKLINDHDKSQPLYMHISHAAPHVGGGLVNIQPPLDNITENDHIAHSARRLYADLVTSMDRSIGKVMAALAENEMLQNTLVIFVSDNGADVNGLSQNFGCNLPLRGTKNTPWEGAARSAAVMWHASLPSNIWNGIFHVTDWLPTLVAVAGGNVNQSIDGINQWNEIANNGKSNRNDVLITVDDLNGWAAFREGDFKIIVGELCNDTNSYLGKELKTLRREGPAYETMLQQSETFRVFQETLKIYLDTDKVKSKRNNLNLSSQIETEEGMQKCIPSKRKGCLFNISRDPLEANDMWYSSPSIVRRLALRLRTLWTEIIPRRRPYSDARADPSLRNYVWGPWLENDEIMPEPLKTKPPFPLHASEGELQYLVDLTVNMFRDKLFMYMRGMSESFVKSMSGLFPS